MTSLPDRRYCQREGCRGWWAHDLIIKRTGPPRRYCKKCIRSWWKLLASPESRSRYLRRAGASFADVHDDRVGLRVDRPYGPCERCLDRPARKSFSFCMQCSVCASCGKNKPETGSWRCRTCRLSQRERARERSKLPEQKAKRSAYDKSPKVKDLKNKRDRERRRNDPKYREKRLAKDMKRTRTARAERNAVTARRVCGRTGCTTRLFGRNANSIYCSQKCGARERYSSNPEHREKIKARVREWRRSNPQNERLRRRYARDLEYRLRRLALQKSYNLRRRERFDAKDIS